MMIASIRTSKRLAFGSALAFGFLCLCLLAVKDLNDKLGVMTASNAGYQKMTDTQAEKIKTLTVELEALRASKASELKSAQHEQREIQGKLDGATEKFQKLKRELQSQIEELSAAKIHLESERDELVRLNGRQKQDADQLSVQLRDQIARMSLDRDSCQNQYDALFKLHQEASDKLAKYATKPEAVIVSSSTKSNRQQLQIPSGNNNQGFAQESAAIRDARSSSSHPVGLEEPRVVQLPQQVGSLSTAKGGLAPVGAQPPLGNLEVVPYHQVHKEDVMEAPKSHHNVMRFENLDAQVDPVHHDHPGLQAPVYRDNHNIALDEDDLEDAADGQIPNEDYQDEKAPNQRYDHALNNDIDYDFQADFQQQPRNMVQQRFHHQRQVNPGVYKQQQPPIVIQPRQVQQQRYYAAPQVGQPQFHYGHGL